MKEYVHGNARKRLTIFGVACGVNEEARALASESKAVTDAFGDGINVELNLEGGSC
jgi:hypothetical protein